jgi:hypothetical protein
MPYNWWRQDGFQERAGAARRRAAGGSVRIRGRDDIDEKNLLAANEVDPAFVIRLLLRCTGRDYACRKHHFLPHVLCHVFTPVIEGESWYVKAYFLSARAVFISVHR